MKPPGHEEGAGTYRELFERSADAILIIEGDRFIDCNDATVRMLRYASRDQLLQTHPSELSPPLQPDGRSSFEKANQMIAIAFERGSHRFEWDHRRADGDVFPVEVLLTAVRETGRRVLHVVWRDITERRSLEERLRHAQKMEAVGKLAGGIAHDFNNLLVVVLGESELLAEKLRDVPLLQAHIEAIRNAGLRAADLVRQLLAFGRKQELQPTVLALNALLAQVRLYLARLIGEDIRLSITAPEEPVFVRADRAQIEQVLLNLASNARDAMPGGGTLSIRLTHEEVPGELAGKLNITSGQYAIITVVDSGFGMDAATAARAFEPFFTTKPIGKGTGLGLATAFGAIAQSGGAIFLDSEPGAGTKISIYLPVTSERPGHDSGPGGLPGVGPGSGRILVVEDEPAVLDVVTRSLRSRGYDVVEALSAEQALALCREHGRSIRMLISDVIMPGVSGPELVEQIENLGLRPAVLFMSGYTDGAISERLRERPNVDLLEKPFDVSELVRRVAVVLGSPKPV